MGRFLNKVAQKVSTFKDKFNNVITWPEVEKLEAPAKSVTPSHFSHGVSPVKNKTTKPYIGIPAPDIISYDPWFAPPIKTDKQTKMQKQKLEAVVREEAEYKQKNKEPKNIHEVLYKKAAAHMKNSWQENLGGSENFHEGPGGWTSGTGQNQFR